MENEDLQQLTIDSLRSELKSVKAEFEKQSIELSRANEFLDQYASLTTNEVSAITKMQRMNADMRAEIYHLRNAIDNLCDNNGEWREDFARAEECVARREKTEDVQKYQIK